MIKINQITISEYQRETMPWTVQEIVESIEDHGYNPAYPIVLDEDDILVDGGHRVKAAGIVGLTELPFVRKPAGVSNIKHSILCNADRAKGREDDVFDLASLCWRLNNKMGMSQTDIGSELGSKQNLISYYIKIKTHLHPTAWKVARLFITKNSSLPKNKNNSLVIKGYHLSYIWRETYFRPITSHIPCNGERDNATMRAQLSVIGNVLDRWQTEPTDKKGRPLKVTAKWIEELAIEQAWHIDLKRYVTDNLKGWVGLRRRIELLKNINAGNFGIFPDAQLFEQLKNAVEALNGKSPTLIVGKAEALPPEIKENSIDIFITSPPYNKGREHWPMGGEGRTPRESGIGYDEHNDQKPEDEYQRWQVDCLKEMYRVAKDGASLFYNHQVRIKKGVAIHPMQWLLLDDNPWTLRQEIVWDRTSTHNHSPQLFCPEDERIYWMVKGDRPNIYNDNIAQSIIWRFHGPQPNTWHPAPFPPELPRRCLKAIGGKALTVLDPFAGSCTTLKVPLEEFGFEATGVDISKEYLQLATDNYNWNKDSIICFNQTISQMED